MHVLEKRIAELLGDYRECALARVYQRRSYDDGRLERPYHETVADEFTRAERVYDRDAHPFRYQDAGDRRQWRFDRRPAGNRLQGNLNRPETGSEPREQDQVLVAQISRSHHKLPGEPMIGRHGNHGAVTQ